MVRKFHRSSLQLCRMARELLQFALDNKKWWLVPVIVVTLLMVVMVVLSATPLAPFIYTVF